MAQKIGFDFDDFGGNVDIVIINSDSETLNQAAPMLNLRSEGEFKQRPGQDWSHFEAKSYSYDEMQPLAVNLSKTLKTKALYYYFGDASGWMGYKLFIHGNLEEEYQFGESYEEEMLEMGIDPTDQTQRAGTVVAKDEDGNQFIFWSTLRVKSEAEICGGETFIDEFLRSQNAYIGWGCFPTT